ncbi:prolyl oligopeptidase family serine peptidase [Phenylobacterium sp.]|uniref:alpha/beta hydrolase family protein n=1 Tax=Phenylobacterium sp. TaxID=1871053 RepID=UPI00120CFD49|nr:prolyl oligopeptidase family serine peptidase [Phenylobacterium sp.]THD59081.1 MAG: S9 family peptidase [Phenylobacterium sp.]
MHIWLVLAAALAAAAPTLATAAPPPLDAYGRLPAIEDAALSPSGGRFAVVMADKDGRKVVVRKSDGEVLGGVAFGPAKIRGVDFAGEDHVLITVTATVSRPVIGLQTTEMEGLIDFNLKTRASYMIFAKSNTYMDAIAGFYGARQVGGKWYAYVGGVTWDAVGPHADGGVVYADLYRVDLDTGHPEKVATSAQRDRDWLIGVNGEVLANSVYDANRGQYTIYPGAGMEHPLIQRAGDSSIDLLSPGRTPGTVVVIERTKDTIVGREIPLSGAGEGSVLISGDNAAGVLVDRDTNTLVGMSNLAGEKLLDPVLQRRIDSSRAAFAGEESYLAAFSHDFAQMIFRTEGPHDAGRYWLVDAVARSATPLGDVHPDVPAAEVGPTRMFAYNAADGLAMDGVLTLPPGREAKNLPVIVMPHGGPIVVGDRVGFDWWAQALASRGYAVFQPNYRGTLGYGESFRHAADGQYGRKMQTDISDGLAALAHAGIVDPKRACIVGASYGGYAALAGVTLQRGLYRCAVSVAGVADMGRMLIWTRERGDARDTRAQDFWRGLTGAQTSDMDAVSPLKAASKADAPILLIHGADDSVVPIDQSRAMQKALASAGKPVDFVLMNGEDHWLSSAPTRLAMLNAVVAFVEKHDPAN